MQKPKLLWLNIMVFAVTNLVTLVGVPVYALMHGFDGWQIAAMVLAIGFCEISITAGYHRLWAHKAYQAHGLVRLIFMIGGTFATQNSILHWVSDHRRHHRHVDDTQHDPYSASRGFWYSHIGWMLREYGSDQDYKYNNCNDLKQDKIVMWQHRHYLPLVLAVNMSIPVLLGLWHGDMLGMILLLGFARLVISHHFTFFINSLAHIWGRQPYSDQNSSRDNGFLAILTMGEGYHNFYHAFQRDYRNGIHWWQFDPTKWLIQSLALIGMADKLYSAPVEKIEISRARMLLIITSRKLEDRPHADILLQHLQGEYEALLKKVNEFAHAQKLWIVANKASAMEACDMDALKEKVDILKQNLAQQKKAWLMLNAKIA